MSITNKAYSGYSIADPAEARRFYGGVLGLTLSEESPGFITLPLESGAKVLLYTRENHIPAEYTVLNFEVDDIDSTVDELVARGVEMTRYPGMPQDDRGILRGLAANRGPDIAWFTDPCGNVLSVMKSQ